MLPMSKRPHNTEVGDRTIQLEHKHGSCCMCDLPAVEALRLDETMVFPVPLCRNHVRKARKFEKAFREDPENRAAYLERVRDVSVFNDI